MKKWEGILGSKYCMHRGPGASAGNFLVDSCELIDRVGGSKGFWSCGKDPVCTGPINWVLI